MKTSHIVTVLGTTIAVATAAAMLRSSPGLSRDLTPPAEDADVATAEAAAHANYRSHLATNDAAAERWRSEHGEGRPTDPNSDEPLPSNAGCPEGTQYWRRDRITELCAPLCAGDQDCGPEDGRCRLLDVEERDESAPIVLVDETPVEEIEAVELDGTKQAPPVRVCDPFWDVEGALDADLVAVAE
jgi:hypothetical protein